MSLPAAAVASHDAELSHWRIQYAPVVAAVLAFVVYAVTLHGTYIYDDVAVVQRDARVHQVRQWGKLWTQPYYTGSVDKLYRPLTSMSFAIENLLHGDRPWVFHLVNVLLHAGTAAMVAILGLRLGGQIVGWVAGALFAVHPVHVEAVAGLVGRAESLCALAMLGGVWLFLRPGRVRWPRVLGIWACLIVAVLSKEQGILFPALLIVAMPLRYRNGLGSDDRQRLKYLAVLLFWTLAGYLLWREHVASLAFDRALMDWIVNPMVRSGGLDRVLMPVVLLGRYALLLVFPLHLSIDYGGMTIGWHASARDPFLYVGFLVLAAWCVATVVAWRRRNFAMLFCLVSLALSYGLIGNIVALIGTIFGERLIYLPSAFFLLAVGLAFSRFSARTVAPIVCVLLVLGGIRTYTYARQWNDALSFYQSVVRQNPNSERGYALLWTWYQERGQWRKALEVGSEARQMLPAERYEPYIMCIQSELGLNDFDAAEAAADAALGHVSKIDRIRFSQWKSFIEKRRLETGAR